MLINKYDWIVFDADETLFHFDAFAGLQTLFLNYLVEFTREDYDAYQLVNKALWVEYQQGNLTAKELQIKRFMVWGERLNISPEILNSGFLAAMLAICKPIDGAVSLLHALKGKIKLCIITNGFTALQQARLERTGLQDHFDFVVVSEQVGIAKPHIKIFEHAFALMGYPDRDRILMVGDTLESDILGGINAGLDTCWVNMNNRPASELIVPTFQVASLQELEKRLTQSTVFA